MQAATDSAFVAGAGQAERNVKRPPVKRQREEAALCPLQGVSGASVRERWSCLHERYAQKCKWDEATKDLPTEFLDSRSGLLGAQQLVKRKGDGASHADMLLKLRPQHHPGAARRWQPEAP